MWFSPFSWCFVSSFAQAAAVMPNPAWGSDGYLVFHLRSGFNTLKEGEESPARLKGM